jgi:hypothetical protein
MGKQEDFFAGSWALSAAAPIAQIQWKFFAARAARATSDQMESFDRIKLLAPTLALFSKKKWLRG